MSHAASSGYGSARSNNNRILAEVVGAGTEEMSETPLNRQEGRMRNSFLNSLRQGKLMDSALLFRSLRMPRTDPSPVESKNPEPVAACLPIDTLALRDSSSTASPTVNKPQENQHVPAPVPAPRFHTLKRHAYQNIPLPLHKKRVEQEAQIIQVRSAMTEPQ